jgi:ABC-type multidrug transport system fused ATPase/permease subunit
VILTKIRSRPPLIRKAIFKAYGLVFILNGIWKLVWGAALWFAAYWLLKKTIQFVRLPDRNRAEGHGYALGFLFSSLIVSVSIHQLISNGGCLGIRVKSALMVQIFRKSLVLARIKGGAGDIVNLVSNDCQKIADACTNLHYMWSGLLEIIAILSIAFAEIQISALPALVIILILMPGQVYMGLLKSRIGFEQTQTTSKRVHIMSEILTAIKLIKFYAWEQPFFDRIVDIRKKELGLLRKNLIINAINFMIVIAVPILITLFALIIYWKSGNILDPVIGFTIVSVFSTLRYPLLMTPLAINSDSGILN